MNDKSDTEKCLVYTSFDLPSLGANYVEDCLYI